MSSPNDHVPPAPPTRRRAGARVAWYRSARFWVSILTAVLVGLIVWAAWPNIVDALARIREANPWILLLLVPTQLLSFVVTGEVLFSYLRARGELRGMRPLVAMRMSLEFNFANHMLPSGGAAGITYTSWKLSTLGVAPSKATLAQLARFAVTFVSFALVVVVATVALILEGYQQPAILSSAVGVCALAIGTVAVGVLVLRRRRLLHRAARLLIRVGNGVGRLFGKPRIVAPAPMIRFFDGLHLEYRALFAQPAALVRPFLWSFLVHAADAGLFWIALAAFNLFANPALILVAYGAATVASILIVTPNGIGAYEVILISLLAAGGLPGSTVIAAIVVSRAILLLGTILFGWAFYQHSVLTATRR